MHDAGVAARDAFLNVDAHVNICNLDPIEFASTLNKKKKESIIAKKKREMVLAS